MTRTRSKHARQFIPGAIAIFAFVCSVPLEVRAQATFKSGDKVLASPAMMKDEKYYKPCTVVKFDSGSNSYLLDCEGTEYNVPPTYVRAEKKQADASDEGRTPGGKPKYIDAKPTDAKGQFKVGDRVLASVSGIKAEKYFQPCTVTGALKDNSYPLKCDPHNGQPFMEYSVRPEWIKVWENATPEPVTAECPFNKNFGKFSKNAKASAALFQSVIFEWQKSTSDFYDFGLTFLDFQLGRTFKNAAIGNGRKLVDPAPIGVTIHNVEAKELICQKSSTITKRWVREISYACYISADGDWVCKNGAPKYLEQTSIPNK